MLPPAITQYYLPTTIPNPVYRPVIVGSAKVQFTNDNAGLRETRSAIYWTPLADTPTGIDWDSSQTTEADFDVWDMSKDPAAGASFAPLPGIATRTASYDAFQNAFVAWLLRTKKMTVQRSPGTGVYALPDEAERDFRIRNQQAAREQRDKLAEDLRTTYKPQFDRLQDRLQRAQLALAKEQNQSSNTKINAAISIGAAVASELFSSFLGRKVVSVTNLNKAVSAVRAVNRARSQTTDVDLANDTVGGVQQQIADLQQQFDQEVAAQQAKIDPATEALDTITIVLKKSDIAVELVDLAWQTPSA